MGRTEVALRILTLEECSLRAPLADEEEAEALNLVPVEAADLLLHTDQLFRAVAEL